MCGLVKRVKKSTHLDDTANCPQPSRSDADSDIAEECRQLQNASHATQSTSLESRVTSARQMTTQQSDRMTCDWSPFSWTDTEDTILYSRRRVDETTTLMSTKVSHTSPQVTSSSIFTPSPMYDVCMAETSASFVNMCDEATPYNDVSMVDDANACCDDVEMLDDSAMTAAMSTPYGMTSDSADNAARLTSDSNTPVQTKATRKQIRQFVADQSQTG